MEVDPEDISVTFDDVKGADEAKQELKDVVGHPHSFICLLLGEFLHGSHSAVK